MQSVFSIYFCFFSSLALSTRPMRTSWVTTCLRVRLLLLSKGSRVSTMSGTKAQWTGKKELKPTVCLEQETRETTKGNPTIGIAMLHVELAQLLFLLLAPCRFLSLPDRFKETKLLLIDICLNVTFRCTHAPIFAVAFGHLANSPHIFPEEQFNKSFVVLCSHGKESVHYELGKGHQFL